ncbi:uncharacterized protein JN550_006437 [Neoarthrinium moseri]|uniref:uncharacterized protein n=1 Tax=Neoarthrinium moseri TaxID=1658444 RepID=UPI001FDE1B48|nr:uncharacterized protein JN550_006437 [Neoarthrinium moseri]KAI1868521.1 hypothetical protein JN550_006437 [Neoarthrinium moseri]
MAPVQRLANTILPTRSISDLATKILPRQASTTTIVATTETTSGGTVLSGGAIAGIVIGSIAGFLLILWLLRSCTNLGSPGLWGSTFGSHDEKPPKTSEPAYLYTQETRGGHRHGHHHHHGHRSRSRHSHYDRSPRRSVEVRNVTTTRPVYTERGRSPRAPQPTYHARDARDARRERRSSRTYYG